MQRRGFSLERQINRLIEAVNNNGGHGHKNHAERTVDGMYIDGEPFDYEIVYDGKIMCFDAKESRSADWALSNAKLKQVKHLKACRDNGIEAFFLVYFYPSKQLVKFDVQVVLKALQDGKKHLNANDGEQFKFKWKEV